jgi:hypothetical protein
MAHGADQVENQHERGSGPAVSIRLRYHGSFRTDLHVGQCIFCTGLWVFILCDGECRNVARQSAIAEILLDEIPIRTIDPGEFY